MIITTLYNQFSEKFSFFFWEGKARKKWVHFSIFDLIGALCFLYFISLCLTSLVFFLYLNGLF